MSAQFDNQTFLKNLTSEPGVYRMMDTGGDVIYVGKAKNLKKRLSSYFRSNLPDDKTRVLVSNIANIEITLTNTETEALILENNLIKQYMPRYNILLRDDKSYPYILLTDHKHPRLAFHRGARNIKGEYFGPYPSAGAVSESLRLMQKLFSVRQCEDAYYRARSRPCLQYQLKRCSAPCVNRVTDAEYSQEVGSVRKFLQGKSTELISDLVVKMEQASMSLAFEQAAKYRDQIQLLNRVQEQQTVSGKLAELDVVGMAYLNGIVVIHVLMIRDHKVIGSKTVYPKVPKNSSEQEVLASFCSQYYFALNQSSRIVKEIVVPFEFEELTSLSDALSQLSERKVSIVVPKRGEKLNYLSLANKNAMNSLQVKQSASDSIQKRYNELCQALSLDQITRMECFDISHTMGENTVASCVVFDEQGPNNKEYRRFNVTDITPGDDYAAMAFALKKRYGKLNDEGKIPDVIFIDGGKGQLRQAEMFFATWPHNKTPLLVGVAKGTSRKPGLETLLLNGGAVSFNLPSESAALHLIQHIRDESHRFAISGHRHKRQKQRTQSILQDIPGIGPKKRQAVLKYLGGIQGVKNATIQELERIPGISHANASKIYAYLHEQK